MDEASALRDWDGYSRRKKVVLGLFLALSGISLLASSVASGVVILCNTVRPDWLCQSEPTDLDWSGNDGSASSRPSIHLKDTPIQLMADSPVKDTLTTPRSFRDVTVTFHIDSGAFSGLYLEGLGDCDDLTLHGGLHQGDTWIVTGPVTATATCELGPGLHEVRYGIEEGTANGRLEIVAWLGGAAPSSVPHSTTAPGCHPYCV